MAAPPTSPRPPPQAALLSRILEGGACSGVVAPGLGEMGERGWRNEVLEKGAGGVGWGVGGAEGSGCFEKLERIISEPDQTRK